MDRIKIKSIRKNLNLTQAKFAEKMGVTLQTIQHWEAGRRSPSGTAIKLMTYIMKEKCVDPVER